MKQTLLFWIFIVLFIWAGFYVERKLRVEYGLPRFNCIAVALISVWILYETARKNIFEICKPWWRFVDGEVIIVTGASTGIGKSCAQQCLERKAKNNKIGAEVTLAARQVKKCEKAIVEAPVDDSELRGHAVHLDLGSFESVKKFASDFKKTHDRLDYLVCNAAYHGPLRHTVDGLEQNIGVTHYGHTLLIHELWPLLVKSGTPEKPSKVVIVASDLHRFTRKLDLDDYQDAKAAAKYGIWKNYCNSKLCNILFGIKLSQLAKDTNVNVQIVHPGTIVRSELTRELWMINNAIINPFKWLFFTVLCRTEWAGAQNLLYAMTNREEPTGTYIENCFAAKPSKLAQDRAKQFALWNKTCNVLKIKSSWPKDATPVAE